jgi:predicted esterase
VIERFANLCKEYSVDLQRIVLAGFSQGGGLALWLALSGAIKVRGLILVGPFLTSVNDIIPLLETHDPKGMRVYLVAGHRDQYCLGIAKQLAVYLPKYDVICHLDEYADLEHSFPKDYKSSGGTSASRPDNIKAYAW